MWLQQITWSKDHVTLWVGTPYACHHPVKFVGQRYCGTRDTSLVYHDLPRPCDQRVICMGAPQVKAPNCQI